MFKRLFVLLLVVAATVSVSTPTHAEETLTVVMSGPGAWISDPGYYTYSATVSGGSGRYMYTWYYRGCFEYGGGVSCPSDYMQISETQEGLNAITRYVGWYDVKHEVVLQVQEISSADSPLSWKGTSYNEGPMWVEQMPTHEWGFNCGANFNWYPLSRLHRNGDGSVVWQEYYRDICNGNKVYR